MAEEQITKPPEDFGQFGASSRIERESPADSVQNIDANALEQAQKQDLQTRQDKPDEKQKTTQQQTEGKQDERHASQGQDEQERRDEAEHEEEVNPLDVLPKSKKKQKDWLNLREHYEDQIKDLKTQVEQAKSNPEFQKLQEELNEYKELLKEVSIERDPSFNKQFQVKKESIINQVKAAAGSKATELAELLDMPDSNYRSEQINALKDGLSDSAKHLIDQAVGKLIGIELDRKVEIDSRKSNWEENQQKMTMRQQQAAKERASEFDNAFNKTLRQWQDEEEGHFLYQVSEENKSSIDKDVRYAKSLVESIQSGSIKPADAAKVGLHLAAIPRLQSYLENVINERDELKAKVEKFYKSSPEGGTSGGPQVDPSKPKSWSEDGYADHFVSGLENAQRS